MADGNSTAVSIDSAANAGRVSGERNIAIIADGYSGSIDSAALGVGVGGGGGGRISGERNIAIVADGYSGSIDSAALGVVGVGILYIFKQYVHSVTLAIINIGDS